jgi:hypothetical protein
MAINGVIFLAILMILLMAMSVMLITLIKLLGSEEFSCNQNFWTHWWNCLEVYAQLKYWYWFIFTLIICTCGIRGGRAVLFVQFVHRWDRSRLCEFESALRVRFLFVRACALQLSLTRLLIVDSFSRSIRSRPNPRGFVRREASTINIHTYRHSHTDTHTHTHTYRRPGLTAICHSSEEGCFVIWMSGFIIIISCS